MKDIVRQLAAQGWSEAAIASAANSSSEKVRRLLALSQASSRPSETGASTYCRATLERFAKSNAARRAKGQALQDEIEPLMDVYQGRGSSKRIRPQLSRPVALRTVQWHITAIKKRRDLANNKPSSS